MSLSLAIGFGLTTQRRVGASGPQASINGLDGGFAIVGTQATISGSVSGGDTVDSQKWGTTPAGTQLGTGTNPTAFSADTTIYWAPTVDGVELNPRSIQTANVAPATSGTLADVAIIVGATGTIATASAFTFAGTRAYSLIDGPAGATINTSTGVIDLSGVAVGAPVSATVRLADATYPQRTADQPISIDVDAATITIIPAVSNAGIGTVFVGETHAAVLARMTTPPGTDVGNAPEGETDGQGTVSRTVTVTEGADPFTAGAYVITVRHAAAGAPDEDTTITGTVIAATITAAGTDAPSTAGIASILDGATITQILAAMTDLGNPSTDGVGSVTTTRSVTVNGTPQTGSATVSEDDAVRVIVTYSATGAPNLAFTLGPVTVTVATGNTTNIIAVPDGFNVLSLADRTPLVITAVPDGFNTVLET